MKASRKRLLVAGGLLGFLIAIGLRVAQGGVTSSTVVGALIALVAAGVALTIVLTRQPRAATTPAGKGLPKWVWWALGLGVILRAVTYFMDRYMP